MGSVISLLLLSGTLQESRQDNTRVYETQIHFRWNQTNYEENYLTNSDAANKLCSMLEEIGLESIDSVNVVAYASPEGVYEHNMMLSRNRAQEFNAAVRERIGLGGSSFKLDVRPGGEAWELLRTRVVADTVVSETARSRVLNLLDDDSVARDTKKWRMMHNYLGNTPQEGDVYHWLLLNHYRYLRCLAVNIYIREQQVEISPRAPLGRNDNNDTTSVITNTTSVITNTTSVITDTSFVIPSEVEESPVDSTAVTHIEEMPDQVRLEEEAVRHEDAIPAIPDIPVSRKTKPIIGLSTNLLYDVTYMPGYGLTSIPSFSLEYYPAEGHYTFGADVEWPHWLHPAQHRYNQIHNITLWGRRYFKSGEDGFRGCYVLANINAAQYGIGWDQKGWEGEGAGISAGIGYKWTFGRFYLDLGAAAGFFYSKYDPYVWGNDSTGWYYYDYYGPTDSFTPRRMVLTWFGPTRAYISIGYNLFNRRK